MNREDIIKLARESGMELYGLGKNRERFIYHLERFTALVAAAEREACIEIVDINGGSIEIVAAIRARNNNVN